MGYTSARNRKFLLGFLGLVSIEPEAVAKWHYFVPNMSRRR